MNSTKILIVEDELIVAENLKDILTDNAYQVVHTALRAEEALDAITTHEPNILLIDIVIQGEKDGVELAKVVRKNYNLPFIFITAYTDKRTLERAKEAHPYGYIVKPFKEKDIKAAIEIAMSNFAAQNAPPAPVVQENTHITAKEHFFIRDKGKLVKLKFKEIVWLEADGNYTTIHTKNAKYALRTTLKEIEEQLPPAQFLRVHKSNIVNIEEITAINSQHLFIDKKQISIGRSYYQQLLSQLNIFTPKLQASEK